MRLIGFAAALAFGAFGCVVGSDSDPNPDPDPDPVERTCGFEDTIADTGPLAATVAQQCNVPMSQGQLQYYRVSAAIPNAPMDILQIELWDGRGVFTGGLVTPGTYELTGAELDRDTCGICVRGLGDKGSEAAMEYFATGGSVTITAVTLGGGAFSAEATNVTFGEVDAATGTPVTTDPCTSTLARVQVDGTLVVADQAGGGGGNGNGGGGGGGGGCPDGIGD